MSCGSRARENSDEKFPSTHGITSSNSTSIIIPTFWRRYLTGIPTPNALPHWIRPRRLLPHCIWWYSDGKGGRGPGFILQEVREISGVPWPRRARKSRVVGGLPRDPMGTARLCGEFRFLGTRRGGDGSATRAPRASAQRVKKNKEGAS
jgi:hypothetical protein